MHSNMFLHNHLSLSNVYVTSDGKVKVFVEAPTRLSLVPVKFEVKEWSHLAPEILVQLDGLV